MTESNIKPIFELTDLLAIPSDHYLRAAPLSAIGAESKYLAGGGWKRVEAHWGIGNNNFNDLGSAWTDNVLWRAPDWQAWLTPPEVTFLPQAVVSNYPDELHEAIVMTPQLQAWAKIAAFPFIAHNLAALNAEREIISVSRGEASWQTAGGPAAARNADHWSQMSAVVTMLAGGEISGGYLGWVDRQEWSLLVEDARDLAKEHLGLSGAFSGKVLAVENGVVSQKIGRHERDVVHYPAVCLNRVPDVDEVIDVVFKNGHGQMSEKAIALER